MATTTTSTLSELVFPGLKGIFGDQYDTWQAEYTQFMDIVPSGKSFEDYQELTGFGLVPEKPEGANVSFDDPIQGFKTTLANISYGLGFRVTQEMMDDDLYNKINAMPKMLAFSVMQTVETLNANLLNNGFNVLFPGADGEPLFSLVHPNPGGGTFSNTLATPADLSDSSFEQALIDVANLENGRNLKIKVQAMKLIVDPTEFYTASKILESTLEPESANNAINPAKGILPGSFMQDHYLSDPDKLMCPAVVFSLN